MGKVEAGSGGEDGRDLAQGGSPDTHNYAITSLVSPLGQGIPPPHFLCSGGSLLHVQQGIWQLETCLENLISCCGILPETVNEASLYFDYKQISLLKA